MGKCSNCGKPILYNKFKRYRGKILCYECYDTRLVRKRAKKKLRDTLSENMNVEKEVKDFLPLAPAVLLDNDGEAKKLKRTTSHEENEDSSDNDQD